jgi:hypothetical protein
VKQSPAVMYVQYIDPSRNFWGADQPSVRVYGWSKEVARKDIILRTYLINQVYLPRKPFPISYSFRSPVLLSRCWRVTEVGFGTSAD